MSNPSRRGVVDLDADYLDTVDAQPIAREYKAYALACLDLRPGQRVLDAGCGTGRDTLALARRVAPGGQVLGIDVREEMVAEARSRADGAHLPVTYRAMDVTDLRELEDGSFDAARVDRVLHTLDRPDLALGELRRVVRAGGRLVACEPDFTSLVIDCDAPELTRAVLEVHRREAASAPGQGRLIYRRFGELGLVDRELRVFAGTLTDLETAKRLLHLAMLGVRALVAGAISRAQLVLWHAALIRSARRGHFHASMMLFTTAGTISTSTRLRSSAEHL